ncbi:nicotinate mononucleotide-dependent phosphoribosyltransferase CobT [Microcoleus sp. bin38.metabat.b11b12b14.051]|uniref:nicotinate mononucleotide-dependent phosphoribosyltransferase CobT n=1 Tax=Microcoleus sp. bin38.metabat.b11b12b14.051 TaxID=2742709 RepID=UPI0025F558B3|nr:TIGR00303 family protein [Microcoleus sp. bin38.metabat.b11b12b14.051]
MIGIYTKIEQGQRWLDRYRGQKPIFGCVLGFTATGLIPGISAAGATPRDRQFTCLADAEFLYNGPQPSPQYPLPPLEAGASPVLISRAVIEALEIPLYLFNAGLLLPPPVPAIDLGGTAAKCLTSGNALELETVKHLLEQGLIWGAKLAAQTNRSYLILGECVVGGTTTALGVLMGLGIAATGKVNSSHPSCNHEQKLAAVTAGLDRAGWEIGAKNSTPLELVAAVGDPMQVAVAGMAIAASRSCGVLLAGGTQMLAVYALMRAIAREYALFWCPEQVAVGTTRWVAEDPTGDTVGLAKNIGGVPLLAAQLSFGGSRYEQLQAYDRGYVKEGVGAGACAIASGLLANWTPAQLLQAVEALAGRCEIKY